MLSMVVMTSVLESEDVMNHVASRKVAGAAMIQFSQEMPVTRSMVP